MHNVSIVYRIIIMIYGANIIVASRDPLSILLHPALLFLLFLSNTCYNLSFSGTHPGVCEVIFH